MKKSRYTEEQIVGVLKEPEAHSKTIETLRIYDDRPHGREVYIALTDGTQISIDITIETKVNARHYRTDAGDLEVLQDHS